MSVEKPPPPASLSSERRRVSALERIAWVLALAFGTFAAVEILRAIADVALLLFAAVLLACLLRGAAEWLAAKLGWRPGWCLALIVVALLLAVGVIGWLRGAALTDEVTQLWVQLNDQLRTLWQRLSSVQWVEAMFGRIRDYVADSSGHLAGIAAGVATSTLGGLGSLLVMLVIAVYLAASPDLYVGGLLRTLPKAWRPRAGEVLHQLSTTLRWWFLGQLVDMLVVGVFTGVGLYLLGVKLAFTLAIIAGLLNFVPYVGAITGAIPAVIVGFGQGPQTALYVIALFVVVQMLEGNVIAPAIQKSTVDLPPVLTILSQTVLGTLFGMLGLILATPLTAAGMVAVRMIYVESILGDHNEADPSPPVRPR